MQCSAMHERLKCWKWHESLRGHFTVMKEKESKERKESKKRERMLRRHAQADCPKYVWQQLEMPGYQKWKGACDE